MHSNPGGANRLWADQVSRSGYPTVLISKISLSDFSVYTICLPYLVPTKNVPITHCSKFGCFNFINLRFNLCFVYSMQNLFQLLSFVQC